MLNKYERNTEKIETWSRPGLEVSVKLLSQFDAFSIDQEDNERELPSINIVIKEGDNEEYFSVSSLKILREVAQILAHASRKADIFAGLSVNEPSPAAYE